MASLTLYPDEERLAGNDRLVFNLYLITGLILFVLMMLLGLGMRWTQAQWLGVPSNWFYQLLSMHGAGMVGTSVMITTATMWFFLRKYVRLHLWAFTANYVLFMLGALCIIGAIFGGGYAALWTFLYPLPMQGMGMWSPGASALFMLGYLLIGVGSLIFYFDAAAGIIKVYGNLGRALGLQWLFGGTINQDHPKAVVASTSMVIANSLGILAGAVALVMSLAAIFFPEIKLDVVLIKTLIYWFGHMYINAAIYMGVIGIYELLPRYTHRPYGLSRPFLWGWATTSTLVIIVFPHHLLMDFAVPHWMLVMGQIASWGSGFPVVVVTTWGALSNIYKADFKWSLPPMLLVLSLFGWVTGGFGAFLDSTIVVNITMHNTQWVPGHFHFYLLLGVVAMTLGFIYHVVGDRSPEAVQSGLGGKVFWLYFAGALIFLFGFLDGGRLSVPRRMAERIDAWIFTDQVGAIGGTLVFLAMLYFAARLTAGLLQMRAPAGAGRAGAAHAAR